MLRYNHSVDYILIASDGDPPAAARFGATTRVKDRVMDDEKFKLEVLNRLDKIVALLSLSCNLSKAALDRMQQEGLKPEAPKPQPAAAAQDGTPVPSRQYQIRDEMQENYELAVRRWQAGRGV